MSFCVCRPWHIYFQDFLSTKYTTAQICSPNVKFYLFQQNKYTKMLIRSTHIDLIIDIINEDVTKIYT